MLFRSRDQVVRFEARLHLKNVLEAADQKTRADQENERQGNLRGHKNPRELELMMAGASAAGALAKRAGRRGARRLQSRGKPENDPGENGDQEREEKHAGTEADLTEAGQVRWREVEQRTFQADNRDKCRGT